jgi:hypothetical protein
VTTGKNFVHIRAKNVHTLICAIILIIFIIIGPFTITARRSIDTILSTGLEGCMSWLEVHRGIWNQNYNPSFHIFPNSWFLRVVTFSLALCKIRSSCDVTKNSNWIAPHPHNFRNISPYTVTSTVFTSRHAFFTLTVNESVEYINI